MIDGNQLVTSVTTVLSALGVFDEVQGHEPKSAPRNGITAATWFETVKPIPDRSGLASLALRFEFYIRLYTSMMAEPQDAIDPNLINAFTLVMATFAAPQQLPNNTYVGGFTLGGTVYEVDLLGAHGESLQSKSGYANLNGKLFRIIDIVCPLIIDDAWVEGA